MEIFVMIFLICKQILFIVSAHLSWTTSKAYYNTKVCQICLQNIENQQNKISVCNAMDNINLNGDHNNWLIVRELSNTSFST